MDSFGGPNSENLCYQQSALKEWIHQPLATESTASHRLWSCSIPDFTLTLSTLHLFLPAVKHDYSSSVTLQRRKREKKKRELLFLTYTDYSIHLTQLLCWKVHLFRLILSHLPGHKITVCTPSKHKVLMLTDCIFGQQNTSKLRRKARLPKAGQSTGSADGLSTAWKQWFREKLLGNGWRWRWGQSSVTNSALTVVHNILAEWSSFPWIPQSMILNFKILSSEQPHERETQIWLEHLSSSSSSVSSCLKIGGKSINIF